MGWEQLKSILDDSRALLREAAQAAPTVCPIDGQLLDIAEDGTRNCRFGNYRWPK